MKTRNDGIKNSHQELSERLCSEEFATRQRNQHRHPNFAENNSPQQTPRLPLQAVTRQIFNAKNRTRHGLVSRRR